MKRIHFIQYFLVGLWVIFTISLTTWWFIFALDQLERLTAIDHASAQELVRYQKMLLFEGATLILCLLGGGLVLVWFIVREVRESARLQTFFATFSHELKTPLASVRLQAETLLERASDPKTIEHARRLVADTVRLTLKLENSLLLARLQNLPLHPERTSLRRLLQSAAYSWPEVEVEATSDCELRVDARAFQSIFDNLVLNSIVHGHAHKITVTPRTEAEAPEVRITISDDGTGFSGNRGKLGAAFERHYTGSGSGLGLYLAQTLAGRMNGRLSFPEGSPGFAVELALPSQVNQ